MEVVGNTSTFLTTLLIEVTEDYLGESEDPPDVTMPQGIEECPLVPYDGISSSTPPPGVLFFNVLGQKLMSKIVGDVLGARSEVHTHRFYSIAMYVEQTQ
ncbi:unnamed protein product [Haemonchus placei]|uniref:Uncharacterized protein n=1 Tax=Haemonchus placei TaxID=6290 RepID=A0A0N4WTC3_HAEPC|nr:unnamed protein product [Haemonchus placei]